VGRAGSY